MSRTSSGDMDVEDTDADGASADDFLSDEYEEHFESEEPKDRAGAADDTVKVEVLTPQDLVTTQLDAIREVNELFQIPASTARILLQHFKWDRERLIERYYGSGDLDRIFAEAHCVKPTAAELDGAAAYRGGELECVICMETKDGMPGLECGCTVCNACLRDYVNAEVQDRGRAEIPCPACDKLMDELTLTAVLQSDPKDIVPFRKYQAALARQFVLDNKLVKFCPSAGCDNAIRISSAFAAHRPFAVRCTCSCEFCFGCSQMPHEPVQCQMLCRWLKKNADDSETSNWMNANTKECPKCHSAIEKHGGCNHMNCHGCRHEFCWVCLGAWAPHGSSWYNCNRFDEEDSKGARDAETKSRAELKRYLHYFNRYVNHLQSLKLEGKLVAVVEATEATIQARTGMSWIEVQFLKKAVESLRRCRQVLMQTYVFAFYLAKTNESELFESNQKDLENATEVLSGYLEQDLRQEEISIATIKELQAKVLDKATYCDKRRDVLLIHVYEGSERGAWCYEPEEIHKMMISLPTP